MDVRPRYKYVHNEGSTHELYDHKADPGETKNLIDRAELRAVRKEMHERLLAWYDPARNRFRAKRKA